MDGTAGYQPENCKENGEFSRANSTPRRHIQLIAFSDKRIDSTPWMAIVDALPDANQILTLSTEDTAAFLDEIASEDTLSEFDVELWTSLVRYWWGRAATTGEIDLFVQRGLKKHPQLKKPWAT